LKGGSINCLCAEKTHEDTINKMLKGMCTEPCTGCVNRRGGGDVMSGGGKVYRWYIVGHGAWDSKFEKTSPPASAESVLVPEPKWGDTPFTPDELINNNLLQKPLVDKTYIILHTQLGRAMLQTAISHIITPSAQIPEGPFKKSAKNQELGIAGVRYSCFNKEIRIFPTKYDDSMHKRGAPSGLYYDVESVVGGEIPENKCRDMRIMGLEKWGISIHHFISDIMKKVTVQYKKDPGFIVGTDVTLFIHLLCCLAPID
jgi:hypothetical protein